MFHAHGYIIVRKNGDALFLLHNNSLHLYVPIYRSYEDAEKHIPVGDEFKIILVQIGEL